jgi:two-component system, OmpR family, phosphate regulon sensor histidine kinase PhoR
MNLSVTEWLIAAALLTLALLLGAITGAWAAMLLGATLIWGALQYRELAALKRWAERPLTRPESRLTSWRNLSEPLFDSLNASRRRTSRVLHRFRGLRVLIDALPDATVIVDRAGEIQDFNLAAKERLRLRDSDRGLDLAALVRQPDFVALIRGTRSDRLIEFASPFDEECRFEARRIVIDDDYVLLLVRDVSQLNRLLTMRQEFIANVSHELRTPLTVVIGYLEAMSSDDIDLDTLRQLLAKLAPPTARMRSLVDDLLLLSRLEASPPPALEDLDVVDVGTVIRGCVAEGRALSEGRHRFETDVDPSVHLLAIEPEIHSAVLNMVTNAVRYSPNGGTVRVTWQCTADGARLAVRDQGLGIAPEHRERITERFYRVDLAKARVRGGTGLGLAIVKHVLKRHHSVLRVDSELGRGSTFYCEFPESQLDFQPAPPVPGPSGPSLDEAAS